MTDIIASVASSTNPSQIIQQKPSKSLTTTIVDDDAKYESDHEQVQVQASKSKLADSFPADDSKDAELQSDNDYVLEPESEQEEPSYSQQTKQDDDIDYVADVYPEFYSQEMESALANVRKLALYHKESLVNSICDTFASFNGREASINDLSAIFGRIKVQLAEEASEDLAESDSFDESEDSDYDPNDVSDRVQVQQDLNEDFLVDSYTESDDESDADDADYNPKNFEDLHQQTLDQEEDIFDSDEPLLVDDTFAVELDESELIESDTFDAEYFEAIKCAQSAAKLDAAKIIKSIKSEYSDNFTEDKLADIISKTFKGIAESQIDEVEESEDEQDDDDESKDNEIEKEEDAEYGSDADEFQKEMDLALDNVRKLASYHQEEFIVKISDLYNLYNGQEASVNDLAAMFAGIKQEFADEAAEEILEDIDEDIEDKESENDADSDYDPKDPADIKQVEQDEDEDYSEDDEENDETAV